jgi:hypothetical protein
VRALSTLDSRLLTYLSNPFIRTRGRVAARVLTLVLPTRREHRRSSPEQRSEECDLFLARSRGLYRNSHCDLRRQIVERAELPLQLGQSLLDLGPLVIEALASLASCASMRDSNSSRSVLGIGRPDSYRSSHFHGPGASQRLPNRCPCPTARATGSRKLRR